MAERVKHLGTAHQGGRLFWGGVKEFADGSLGSRTALMHEPYAGGACWGIRHFISQAACAAAWPALGSLAVIRA